MSSRSFTLILLSLCAACTYKPRKAPARRGDGISINMGDWDRQTCSPYLLATTGGIESFANNILIPRDLVATNVRLTVEADLCDLTWFLPNQSECADDMIPPCCTLAAPNVLDCTFGTPLHPVTSLDVVAQAGQIALPITLTFLPTTPMHSIFADTDSQVVSAGSAALTRSLPAAWVSHSRLFFPDNRTGTESSSMIRLG